MDVENDETRSTRSTKLDNLRNREKSAKERLTRAQIRLRELLICQRNGISARKTSIRRVVSTVNMDFGVIEKVIREIRQIYAASGDFDQDVRVNATIEALDKELEEIAIEVDRSVESAERHVQARLTAGEEESTASREFRNDSVSLVSAASELERKRLEAREASERLERMEQEEMQQEEDLRRLAVQLHLTKQQTEEARKVATLNQARARLPNEMRELRPGNPSRGRNQQEIHHTSFKASRASS